MKIKKVTLHVSFVASLFFALATAVSFAGHSSAKHADMDIVDTAISAGNFNTLINAVKAADLLQTLKGDGPFTVFAPTDKAFSNLPKEDLQALLADKELLKKVLTYHVLPSKCVRRTMNTRAGC